MKQMKALLILLIFVAPFGMSVDAQNTLSAPNFVALGRLSELLYAPCRIAVDSFGNIYVTDPQKESVLVYRPWGALKTIRSGLGLCLSVAVSSSDVIYVGDQRAGNVTAFDLAWRTLGKLGRGDGEFSMPNDIAIDSSTGQIYVADSKEHLIKVYDPSGNRISQFGGFGAGDGELDYPTSVAIDRLRNELLVTDHNNGRVVVFNLDGSWVSNLGRYGSDPGRFTRPLGVCVDKEGRVYVSDAYQAAVQVIDRTGAFLTFIGQHGVKPGDLRLPAGMAIDAHNRFFVASTNNSRVEVFGLDDYTNPKPPIEALIALRPKRMRARRRRRITCFIELPGHDVNQIHAPSIRLNDVVPCESRPIAIRDHDRDGTPELMVKFPWPKVLETIEPGDAVVLTVTGQVAGETFEGSSVIKVSKKRRRGRKRRGK